jgi:hypothetical protein
MPPWPATLSSPSRAARTLAPATLLAGFLAGLYGLDRAELVPSVLRTLPGSGQLAVYGAVAAAGFAGALAPITWRRTILLAATLVAAPIALGVWSAALLGHAAWVIAIARAPIPLAARLLAAVAAWLALPIARARWLDGDAQADTLVLAIVWAGQLYAALYLMIEREREPHIHRPTVLADAFYLLAPPRLITPFFQPISPRQLARRQLADPPARAIGRAAWLAGYAAGVAVLAHQLDALTHRVEPWPLALAIWFCAVYARITYTIFIAIAVFRLLGFDLPAGFRTPFLSSSFAEFFRRFNYYVRDAVLSLFYYPLLGRLRRHLSPRVASIVSAYLAILAGSFLFHDLLIPLAITVEPASVMGRALDPIRLAGFVALWTLTIVPTAGLAPRRPPPRSRTRTIAMVLAFNLAYLTIWYAQLVGRGRD